MRYFIITGRIKSGWFFKGNEFCCYVKSKQYPTLDDIHKKTHPRGVILSNIIELSEADYKSFTGEK